MSVCLPLANTEPADHGRLFRAFQSLRARLRARAEERDRRLRLARLLDYDDRMLDDMGLLRADIEAALQLPLERNAIEACRNGLARD